MKDQFADVKTDEPNPLMLLSTWASYKRTMECCLLWYGDNDPDMMPVPMSRPSNDTPDVHNI